MSMIDSLFVSVKYKDHQYAGSNNENQTHYVR